MVRCYYKYFEGRNTFVSPLYRIFYDNFFGLLINLQTDFKGVELNKLLGLRIICNGVQGMFYHHQQMSTTLTALLPQEKLVVKVLQM